jgi:hypothetical protein
MTQYYTIGSPRAYPHYRCCLLWLWLLSLGVLNFCTSVSIGCRRECSTTGGVFLQRRETMDGVRTNVTTLESGDGYKHPPTASASAVLRKAWACSHRFALTPDGLLCLDLHKQDPKRHKDEHRRLYIMIQQLEGTSEQPRPTWRSSSDSFGQGCGKECRNMSTVVTPAQGLTRRQEMP